MTQSTLQYHVFICTNQREGGAASCADHGALDIVQHCKQRIRDAGAEMTSHIRINRAGCLGRCEEGPAMVIYPEGTWYTYVDRSDADEVIDAHLFTGEAVERLKL
jgi:(2Fe-2S) ferredoxin